MDIIINETGERKELSIIDPKTGVNWINDLMGNHDALPEYDDDEDAYRMGQSDYDWWCRVTTDYEAANYRLHDLQQGLDGDDYDALMADVHGDDAPNDLEDLPGWLEAICDKHDPDVDDIED